MSLTDIMSGAGLSGYAVTAMILFIAAFLAVAVRIWWPGRRHEMDAASRLPLDDQHILTPRDGAQP
jgi:cbb3-type cytochrome oxidase subunit 3